MPANNLRRIHSLDGLKLVMVLCIVWWHCMPRVVFGYSLPDLGARCCEVFFLVSGFLEGYRHGLNYKFTFEELWLKAKSKLKRIYPEHAFFLVLSILVGVTSGKEWAVLSDSNVISAICNALLIQAWIPSFAMQFNGLSWFLSSLFFCYLLTPLVAYIALKAKRPVGVWHLLVATMACRVLLEAECAKHPDIYSMVNIHENPLVRLLEYSFAYYLALVYRGRLGADTCSKKVSFLWSVVECVAIGFALYCVVEFNGAWPRWMYTLVFSGVVVIVAGERGILSSLLGCKPMRYLSVYQMQIYISHAVFYSLGWALFPTSSVMAHVSLFVLIVIYCFAVNCLKRIRQNKPKPTVTESFYF
ncbi:acyltransferase family protein [Parolsenella catena]|uniref:acyltransferase family protein n=1 Tax=Parolsenella catena TaxID=2003188 RepID=UPI003F9AB6EC